jgi:hypothetical protein
LADGFGSRLVISVGLAVLAVDSLRFDGSGCLRAFGMGGLTDADLGACGGSRVNVSGGFVGPFSALIGPVDVGCAIGFSGLGRAMVDSGFRATVGSVFNASGETVGLRTAGFFSIFGRGLAASCVRAVNMDGTTIECGEGHPRLRRRRPRNGC